VIPAASPNGAALLEPRGGWTHQHEAAFSTAVSLALKHRKALRTWGWLTLGGMLAVMFGFAVGIPVAIALSVVFSIVSFLVWIWHW
jgi:hypothetical protein